MKLKEYLDIMGISQVRFAQRCGVNTRTIHSITKTNKCIHLSLALTIEELTNGQVTPRELDPREKG